jgi:nickel/cobalt exporter
LKNDHSHNDDYGHHHSGNASRVALGRPHITWSTGDAGIFSQESGGVGYARGIVPRPALVVLLGALAMHRVAFGLFLTVAFSGGVAAVLIGIGLAMVYARRFAEGAMMQRWLPLASSAVIPSSAWH